MFTPRDSKPARSSAATASASACFAPIAVASAAMLTPSIPGGPWKASLIPRLARRSTGRASTRSPHQDPPRGHPVWRQAHDRLEQRGVARTVRTERQMCLLTAYGGVDIAEYCRAVCMCRQRLHVQRGLVQRRRPCDGDRTRLIPEARVEMHAVVAGCQGPTAEIEPGGGTEQNPTGFRHTPRSHGATRLARVWSAGGLRGRSSDVMAGLPRPWARRMPSRRMREAPN